MDSLFQFGCTKSSGIVGSLISVALVFGGSAASAGGLTGFDTPATSGLIGRFSDGDLEQLEHATAADGTAVRLAAMMESLGSTEKTAPMLATSQTEVAADEDLLPHSAQLLPLLAVRPQATSIIVPEPSSFRPGRVQPVGVPRSVVQALSDGHVAR